MAPGAPIDTFTTNTAKLSAPNSGYSKCAYVTFLAGNGDYWKGAVGLAKGLRKVKSAHPLLVAVLPDVPEDHRNILRAQGCLIREIIPVYPPENHIKFAMAHFVINYSKLRIWNFEEYSRMIYLDADIQVYENIDHLFELPKEYLYAVMDCYCEKVWSHSLQYSIGYCQQCPDRVKWPVELGNPPSLYFNAGMFVFEPSKLVCDKLLETLQHTAPTPFAEQDFLNMFFEKSYKPIPVVYNLVLAMLWRHPENVELEKVKVVHYCAAGSKPWRYTGQETNMDREDIKKLVAKWWEIYNDESLDFIKAEDKVEIEVEEEGFSKPSIMAAMQEPNMAYIPTPSAA
ncbi:Inositol 3-alpha-galactosyltransferase protein [Dioscorea alata]|uniref:Inositol 3-alpha-galactosyltransferase protein n=1 Tax=Dioscorea alata TaxID=55571 RepID=A0ACB7TR83_DIOAL|nr:Inositol 3-alpha-galactosyltransferase protein [Dioscorea alata]